MTNRVAVYMICKDEASFITRAVTSARLADEIVVCDTGSSDDTVEKLHELQQSFPQLKVHQLTVSPWRFDDARNIALALVSANIDLCVSLDADEVIDNDFIMGLQHMKDVKPLTHVVHSFQTKWDWDAPVDSKSNRISKHFHERVHTRFGFRWVHPVHEKLVTQQPEVLRWETNLMMTQLPDNSKNRSSYFELLKQAVVEDPVDWKLWSFLAGEHLSRGDTAEATKAYDKAEACPDADKCFIAWQRASIALTELKTDDAEDWLRLACKLNPNLREAWGKLANFYKQYNQTDDEIYALVRACRCTTPTQGYYRDEAMWDGSLVARLDKLTGKEAAA